MKLDNDKSRGRIWGRDKLGDHFVKVVREDFTDR